MKRPELFWPLFILSLAVGAVAIWAAMWTSNHFHLIFYSAYTWIALFVIAAVTLRRRALWLLPSGIFAVGPTIAWWLIWRG